MGNNVRGGVLAAAIIVMAAVAAAADDDAGGSTSIWMVCKNGERCLFEENLELELGGLAAMMTPGNKAISVSSIPGIDCGKYTPIKKCTPDPNNSKIGEHCGPGVYSNRGC